MLNRENRIKNNTYYFLFAYNVTAVDSRNVVDKGANQAIADDVRKDVAANAANGWTKSTKVDTTFFGDMTLAGSDKLIKAEAIVRQQLLKSINGCDAQNKVEIHVVLMVDGLGASIEFTI